MASTDKTKPGEIQFYGGYQVYAESGVDLTLLRADLECSVGERIENNRRALAFVQPIQPLSDVDKRAATLSRREVSMIDPSPVIQLLVKHNVEFIVIGGIAMRARGSAHITEDIDFCYRRTLG